MDFLLFGWLKVAISYYDGLVEVTVGNDRCLVNVMVYIGSDGFEFMLSPCTMRNHERNNLLVIVEEDGYVRKIGGWVSTLFLQLQWYKGECPSLRFTPDRSE
jgi:hypothetical protein